MQTHEEATVCVKELDISLTMKVLENTPAVLSLGKLCDEHGYSYGQCNTENFVPIGVPGLSTSSSSSFPSSTSMALSRLEIDHPTSSSSSSTSPTMTSSTVKRKCGWTRKVRPVRDPYPASVSCEHVERKKTGRLVDQANQKSKTKYKRRPRSRTGRPVPFRNTRMAARVQRKSCG